MKAPEVSAIEPLEARIAPALTVLHPIPDIIPGIGQTGATLDLANAFDAAGTFRTHVLFTTNYIDPGAPGVPQVIELELFNDKAPVTVANFLRYVNGLAPSDFDDVFFHRLVPGFIVQAGGFATDAPGTHIAVDPDVHNEFNPADAERSNLTGTVAMAKTGLGPHTGTSEWFINLGDNAANLDNQNGGFTVFAKVSRGMDVVNAIAMLNRFNLASLNGALTDVPLQHYDPDPDGDPATPAPTPTAGQFITITHAAVVAPTAASAPGVTFSVSSIVNATTLVATDLVTGTVAGHTLPLHFKAGASGVAKVTVKASQAGMADVFEDFLVTLKPNLVASTTTSAPGVIVPGDQPSVTVEIANSGAATVVGNYNVTFYLSKFTAQDPQGTLLETGVDAIVGTLANQSLNIISGGKTSLTGVITVPQRLALVQGENYRIIAEVTQAAGGTVSELFTDDNVALDGTQSQLFNAFGTFAGRTDVVLTYVDAANTTVTATLTGGGFGQFDPQGAGTLDRLAISSTTAASALSLTAGSQTVLDAFYIDRTIGTVDLASVAVKTSFNANGGFRSLLLGDLGDGIGTHPFLVGPFASDPLQKATITLGRVRDIEFISAMPVGALTAVSWLDEDAEADTLTATSIDSILLTGDSTMNGAFQADLTLLGNSTLPFFRIDFFGPANQFTILTVTGGGYAHFTPIRNGEAGPLEVLNTTVASTLTVFTGGGSELGSIDIANAIGAALLDGVTVKGNFEAHAGIQTLTLGAIGDGTATRTLTIGAFAADPAQKVTLTLGNVRDVALTSAMPIATLTAKDWLDSGGANEVITAPAIDAVRITGDATHSGDFDAAIAITGPVPLATFKLGYLDAANQPLTLTVAGGGHAGFGNAGALEIRGTSAASGVSLAGVNASVKTTLEFILIASPIGTAALANVGLKGNFTAQGGIANLTLGNVGDGTATHTLSIGAFASNPAQKATITLGQARDLALTSAMPIGTLTAVDWLDSDASSEGITATAIDSLVIVGDATHRGAFQADLNITGTTKLQTFVVTGIVSNARIHTAGDVGFIRFGALVRSEILVGVNTVPQTRAEFTANYHRIDTFKILNGGAAGIALTDSTIAAGRIGSISVSKVSPASGDGHFGFVADRINNYLVGTKTAFNLSAPMIFDQRSHYAVKIV